MSPAKPADLQTPNSTKERTDCTSSLATPAALDDPSQQSRPVSLPKSARDVDNKVKYLASYIGGLGPSWRVARIFPRRGGVEVRSILSIGLGSWARSAFGG